MDMKCKKLVLLAMQMNDAQNIKIKFTKSKIMKVNMYTSVSII